MNMTVSTTEELYTTVPMSAVQVQSTSCTPSDEEEVYSAFEQAISERCSAFQSYLSRSSASMLTARSLPHQTGPIVHDAFSSRVRTMKESHVAYKATGIDQQIKQLKRMLIISFTLISILVGFDLLGLFMLYLR